MNEHAALAADIRKDIDAIGCIYRIVGEAMFDEARTRLSERIATRVLSRPRDLAIAALVEAADGVVCDINGNFSDAELGTTETLICGWRDSLRTALAAWRAAQ